MSVVASNTQYGQHPPEGKLRWAARLRNIPPWDETNDPISLTGPPAIPVPVNISSLDALAPFFRFLSQNGDETAEEQVWTVGSEPKYSTSMQSFQKGVQFADGRMDLCKMYVKITHMLLNAVLTNLIIKGSLDLSISRP
jgi:hypothetical protein